MLGFKRMKKLLACSGGHQRGWDEFIAVWSSVVSNGCFIPQRYSDEPILLVCSAELV